MKRLLVSNDDGIDSPALAPLLRALAALGEVRCVVPDGQRSWIGAGVSRFDPIRVAPTERGGQAVYACTGTPADCVNVGIHSLFENPPDLVVSGVNLGLNHGDAFVTSSGTIGAAAEGVASGLPAIAASLGPHPTDRGFARRLSDPARAAQWDEAAAIVVDIAHVVLSRGLPDGVDLVSVNIPEGATRTSPREITTVARTAYDRLFHPSADDPLRFRAEFGGLRERLIDEGHPLATDLSALARGVVSITPMRLARGVEPAPAWATWHDELVRRGEESR